IIYSFISVISVASLASNSGISCQFFDYVSKSELNESPKFWEDFGTLDPKSSSYDNDLLELVSRHKNIDVLQAKEEILILKQSPTSAAPSTTASDQKSERVSYIAKGVVEMRKDAVKGAIALSKVQRDKLEQFKKSYEEKGHAFISEINHPHSGWEIEFLKGEKISSLKLQDGMRVTFFVDENHVLHIYDIGKHVYRH
ncbi:MAG: hypothetical protein ABL927_13480, partial [Bdellovibrionales bacterium]